MIHKKIMNEVMSQHFKIKDDLTEENIMDAMDNYTDRLLKAKIIVVQANVIKSVCENPCKNLRTACNKCADEYYRWKIDLNEQTVL